MPLRRNSAPRRRTILVALLTVAPRALRRAFACILVGFALLRHASIFSRAVASRHAFGMTLGLSLP
jgi:hypothetical protein